MLGRMRRKEKKPAVFLAVFIAAIMVTSVIGYIIADNTTQQKKYKGIKFETDSVSWFAVIDGTRYSFSFLPQDVEYIETPKMDYTGIVQLYVTSSPNSTSSGQIAESIFELSQTLSQKGIYALQGFIVENEYSLPVFTCSNATQFVPVIYYADGNSTGIRKEGNCIIIESDNSYSFLPYTDALIYRFLGLT